MKEVVFNYLLYQIPEALAVEMGLVLVLSIMAIVRRKFIYKVIYSFINPEKKEIEKFAYKVNYMYFTANESYDIKYEYN